jgi:hypothetical protein
MIFRWPTPGEKLAMLIFSAGAIGAGVGMVGYWLCDYRPVIFGLAWFGIMSGVVGYLLYCKAYQMSGDDLERARLANEQEQRAEERRARPTPAGYRTIYANETADGITRGALNKAQVDRVRNDLRVGQPLSTRGMSYVTKETWEELHRLKLIRYIDGIKNKGVELTPAGYQWARIPRPTDD